MLTPYRALLDPTLYTVIHNQSSVSENSLEWQLEEALERGFTLIVVEPNGLGNSTIKWIKVGNFLHKSAVLASIVTLTTTPFMPLKYSLFTSIPLGIFGVGCAVMYGASWQCDPCSKYQVDYRGRELTRIPSHEILSPSPVVLVRKNDKYRKILHNSLSLVVVGYVSWLAYKHFYSS